MFMADSLRDWLTVLVLCVCIYIYIYIDVEKINYPLVSYLQSLFFHLSNKHDDVPWYIKINYF